MNPLQLLMLIGQAVIPLLTNLGKHDQAGLLQDALAAVSAGKNIDDIMAAAAKSWKENGEPTFDEIAAAREAIQARMDA
jgi:hypothetical protein